MDPIPHVDDDPISRLYADYFLQAELYSNITTSLIKSVPLKEDCRRIRT